MSDTVPRLKFPVRGIIKLMADHNPGFGEDYLLDSFARCIFQGHFNGGNGQGDPKISKFAKQSRDQLPEFPWREEHDWPQGAHDVLADIVGGKLTPIAACFVEHQTAIDNNRSPSADCRQACFQYLANSKLADYRPPARDYFEDLLITFEGVEIWCQRRAFNFPPPLLAYVKKADSEAETPQRSSNSGSAGATDSAAGGAAIGDGKADPDAQTNREEGTDKDSEGPIPPSDDDDRKLLATDTEGEGTPSTGADGDSAQDNTSSDDAQSGGNSDSEPPTEPSHETGQTGSVRDGHKTEEEAHEEPVPVHPHDEDFDEPQVRKAGRPGADWDAIKAQLRDRIAKGHVKKVWAAEARWLAGWAKKNVDNPPLAKTIENELRTIHQEWRRASARRQRSKDGSGL